MEQTDVQSAVAFVAASDAATHRRNLDVDIAVRNALHSELRGMSEFINLNGRLYRYGFVSRDNNRTRKMLSHMFTPESFTKAVQFPISDWTELDSAKLKLHFQSRRATLPVPPLLEINTDTLDWLKGVYVSLHRLNDHWGTSARSWDDVVLNQDAAREITEDDIDTVHSLLRDLTTRVLAELPPPVTWDVGPRVEGHGVIETIFASLRDRPVQEVYMLMLRYLAERIRNDTFTPLPPGKHSRNKEGMRAFINDFYVTDAEMRREWPSPDLPATTTPSLAEFEHLQNNMN